MSEIYDIKGGRYEREVLPSCADTEFDMVREGWYFADRTLKVTIQLAKVTADLKRLQRLPVVETSDYTEDIFRIAHESFTRDRRFHVAPKGDITFVFHFGIDIACRFCIIRNCNIAVIGLQRQVTRDCIRILFLFCTRIQLAVKINAVND